jgi:hypothetical protein
MKTAGRGTQTRYTAVRSKPSTWGGRAEKILLNVAGWKVREIPAIGEFFSLTSPFIELAETARDEIAGVRSAKECLHEGRQPE